MDLQIEDIKRLFPGLSIDLVHEIIAQGSFLTIPAHQTIIHEGQYIKTIPLVYKGRIRVMTTADTKELLLYYIQPAESCVMSFSIGMNNEKSVITAITEEETEVILLRIEDVRDWMQRFPSINMLFFAQYNTRYADLVHTITSLIYNKLDTRIMQYLQERARVLQTDTIPISHREIAGDLASSREVVTRILKKLEADGQVAQLSGAIKILH
ncbi:MAG: Crp/Fnr family transcriptional regulator [Chitinophagales bacterium]